MLKRARFRQAKGAPNPLAFGNNAAAGRGALASTIWPVTEARSENLPSIFGVLKPCVPRSTTKPRIAPSSFAHTTARSAMGALVIQLLVPFRTKPSSDATARLAMAPGSEP